MIVPTAFVLLCCAAISTTNDPYKYVLTPELGYAQTAFPIVVALVAVAAPVLVARAAAGHGGSPVAAIAGIEVVMLIVAAAMAWWLGAQVAARTAGEAVSEGERQRSGAASVLVARGLSREYGDFLALDSFQVDLSPGQLVALVGPNGAGKTTFLTIAAGLLEPTAGTLDGRRRAGGNDRGAQGGLLPSRTRRSSTTISVSTSTSNTSPRCTVWPATTEPRARQLLERLGLGDWEDSLPSEFSHGMRQKASIALALVRPFSLLLADEPFDGLDPPSRNVLFELLGETREAGAAVVVSTHRRDVVGAADRCLALRDGELAYDGPPDAEALAEYFELSSRSGSAPPA